MKVVRFLMAVIALGLVFVVGFGYGRWYSTRRIASAGRKVLYYVDAMHPWYKSDKPGIAPDCGMKLVPVYADGTQAPPAANDRKILRYRDPKDPAYTSDKPGMNPATGNDLEPVYAGTTPPNAIRITPDKQQLIGVRYGQVEWAPAASTIHAVGRVAPDETAIARIQARTDGWITSVSADFTGKFVARGQTLLTLYSPELFAAQQEYLLALKARTILQRSSMRETAANNDSLVQAARRRLLLLNLTPEQIAEVEQTQKPIESITLYSPVSGYIMTRNAFPGQRVTAETELYTLADLRTVWVMAEVFEADAPLVRLAQPARVSAQGTGRSYFARVTYIQPQVDPATRTLKIRLELANPQVQLKPDMFVDVDMDIAGPSRLSVPADAVLDAGVTKTVFLDRGNGFFEPRAVETGERFGDRVEIVKGLKAGDRIVTSGTFLLNSETQLKEATGGMPDMPGMNMPATDGGAKHDQQHH
ncbi:MAG TPA: efflux RND transporter periplasmic adaptor subunit [Bryobacteraceae bacterium]|nr:efflux RND transporter periplasmic adaptor subunit [Bryobacteraceae bacterium]